MAQYWLQTPIENAKEVVQRFIDNNPGLTYWAGKKVEYDLETEVIFYDFASNYPAHDPDIIYFGSLIMACIDSSVQLRLDDSTATIDTFTVVNNAGLPLDSGVYPYIIWNNVASPCNSTAYFVGYKFRVV